MSLLEPSHLTGPRKAAILLLLLGDELSSALLKGLTKEEVQTLTREIARLDTVDPATAAEVLEEYRRLSLTQDYLARGGAEQASRMLVRAYGEEGAQDLLKQMNGFEKSYAGIESLRAASPQQLAKLLEDEQPQTIALVVAQLDPEPATVLLAQFPNEVRVEVVRRLAGLQEFSPEMAARVSTVLQSKLQTKVEPRRQAYAGVSAVSQLLAHMDAEARRALLASLDREDPELVSSLRQISVGSESDGGHDA